MQPSTDAIAAIVFDAVDDLNKQLPRNKRLDKSPGTRLAGPGGQLDSLGLVNLMVNTEQKLETALGLEVMLAEEAAGATDEQFATIGSFIAFVGGVAGKRRNVEADT